MHEKLAFLLYLEPISFHLIRMKRASGSVQMDFKTVTV